MSEQNRHPYCGIIPSPDKLDRNINSPGLDEIKTRLDFNHVWGWLSECLNTGFYTEVKTTLDKGEQLELPVFKSAIHSAFKAFDPIRDTSSPKAKEMVLLYYAGHGLSVEGATQLNKTNPDGWSSSPRLENVGYSHHKEYFSAAQPHLTRNRNVKGGELCLHDVGFCDLQGLLKPFIAAVKGESTKSFGEKHNKHVVIIADSCYSGKLVEDLARLNQWPGPWNENDCTVTVQSACNSHEVTFGGYFTPCFVYYNQTGGLVQQIQRNIQQIQQNVQPIQENVGQMQNVQQIQQNVQQIQENAQQIQHNVQQIQRNVQQIKENVQQIQHNVQQIQGNAQQIQNVQQMQENALQIQQSVQQIQGNAQQIQGNAQQIQQKVQQIQGNAQQIQNVQEMQENAQQIQQSVQQIQGNAQQIQQKVQQIQGNAQQIQGNAQQIQQKVQQIQGNAQQIQQNVQQMPENDQQIQENAQQIQESAQQIQQNAQQIQENDQQISELDGLIKEWKGKIEIEKDAYREIELPSPQLATTRLPGNVDSENDPVLELSLQGFQMCLFRDAGFFKFCYLKYSGALRPPLALDGGTVQTFLERDKFNIIDYKLTKMRNGTPIALFLVRNLGDQDQVDNPDDDDHVIYVRIHFSNSTTTFGNVGGVNLVQHQRPTYPSLLFLAVNDPNAVWHLNPKEHAAQYKRLVTQCKNYVEATERGRWVDVTRWNMGNNQLGVNHMIRMRDRSTWMNEYVKKKTDPDYSQT